LGGVKRCLYTYVFYPTALIHRRFIQRLEYIGPHNAGPKTFEWAELHSFFSKKFNSKLNFLSPYIILNQL